MPDFLTIIKVVTLGLTLTFIISYALAIIITVIDNRNETVSMVFTSNKEKNNHDNNL